jgi:hypothetical protein
MTVRNAMKAGELVGVYLGRKKVRLAIADVMRWYAERAARAQKAAA